jgi:membrane protein DedA with SNARE-associated domain
MSSWGAWAVFVSVLATQLGVPIPAAPMLVLAGTLVAAGLASFWHMLAAAVIAVVIADSLWFAAGTVIWPAVPDLARAVLTFPRYHFAYRPALVRAVRRAFAGAL